VLDEKGNKIGTPIKASLFYMKPTLKHLEKRFADNVLLKQPHAKRLRTVIDFVLLKKTVSGLEQLKNELNKEKISLVLRQNKEGTIYGITYVDHKTKCVFNGSDLGKSYSAKLMLERVSVNSPVVAPSLADEKKKSLPSENSSGDATILSPQPSHPDSGASAILELVTGTASGPDYIPFQLRKKKRKKRQQLKR
jgi:hypothetical protein